MFTGPDQVSVIQSLDFTDLVRKLQRPEPHGNGWSLDCAENAVKWYRRFLILIAKYPTQKLVPNAMIDAVWHAHITDTRAYHRDCQQVFGRFLHHNPYFGMNGDHEERDEAFQITNHLYRTEFGEDPLQFGDKALECA